MIRSQSEVAIHLSKFPSPSKILTPVSHPSLLFVSIFKFLCCSYRGSGIYKCSNIFSRNESINQPTSQMLSGELSKSDKRTLGGEAIAKRSFLVVLHPKFSQTHKILFTCAEGKSGLKANVCAKQEHLIAMTKIGHFSQMQAVFKKLKYFLEPAIFTEVWNLALRSRLVCAQWVCDGGKSHQVFPQKHPGPRGTGPREQAWSRSEPRAAQLGRFAIPRLPLGRSASGDWREEPKRPGAFALSHG